MIRAALIGCLLGSAVAAQSNVFIGRGGVRPEDVRGPSAAKADAYRPDGKVVRPALGGRVIFHLPNEPPSLNFTLDNSAVTRWVLDELHAPLLRLNWETWKREPELATRYDVEDLLILKGGRGKGVENTLFGAVSEEGDAYVVRSGSRWNHRQEQRVPKAGVESVERATVVTFELRPDALWHDGHPFDAQDVLFSWQIYANPGVDCDEKRYKYADVVHAEVLDPHAIRFFRSRQYSGSVDGFDTDFCILPSHLYNLLDPDNADHDAGATLEAQAKYINDNPHNIEWVGLGPYKLVEWQRGQQIVARKFDGFFLKDPAESGYLDELRWRIVSDDNAAFQALLAGELDIFERVKTEDYKGALTQGPEFTRSFYKAHSYVGNLGYLSWNTQRPELSDKRVRQALAMAFDVPGYIHTSYLDLALQATGDQFIFGTSYNREVAPLPYDPGLAEERLAEAGWYDRDGDGMVDKDGEPLALEALMPSGNKASEKLLQTVQASYAKVGVKLDIVALEWAQFLERLKDRKYDVANLAWTLNDVEQDPYQLWHSSQAAAGVRGSNHAGVADAHVDELIGRARRELEPEARHAVLRELHAYLYDLQPFFFLYCVPRKVAINRELHGVKLYNFEPGLRLRDLYYAEGTEGTRPLSPN